MTKVLLMVNPHSFVDLITNSSTEIFSILGNKEIIEEFINDFIKEFGKEYSGEGGTIQVKTFTEYIDEMIIDGDIWFSEEGMAYYYDTLENYEEQFKFILDDIIKETKENHNQEINPEYIDNMIVIDIDWANKKLINTLKETFGGYINLI